MEKGQRTPTGADIPVPKRSDLLRNLKKAAAPEGKRRTSRRRRPKK